MSIPIPSKFLQETCVEAYAFHCRGCGVSSTAALAEDVAIENANMEGRFFEDGWYCAACAAERATTPAKAWTCPRCGWHYNPYKGNAEPPVYRHAVHFTFNGIERRKVLACPVCNLALDEERDAVEVEPPQVTNHKLKRWIAFVKQW